MTDQTPGTHSQPPHKTKEQEDRDPTTSGDNLAKNLTKEQREREEKDRQAANRSKVQAGNLRDAQAGQPVDYVSRDEHEKLRQRVRALESKLGLP